MSSLAITWYGHATFVLTSPGGKRIVLDPWLSGNPKAPAGAKIDKADIILWCVEVGQTFDGLKKIIEPWLGIDLEAEILPKFIHFQKRIGLRVVAMTSAPSSAAMLTAACPSEDVAPRTMTVWSGRMSRFWCSPAHAEA